MLRCGHTQVPACSVCQKNGDTAMRDCIPCTPLVPAAMDLLPLLLRLLLLLLPLIMVLIPVHFRAEIQACSQATPCEESQSGLITLLVAYCGVSCKLGDLDGVCEMCQQLSLLLPALPNMILNAIELMTDMTELVLAKRDSDRASQLLRYQLDWLTQLLVAQPSQGKSSDISSTAPEAAKETAEDPSPRLKILAAGSRLLMCLVVLDSPDAAEWVGTLSRQLLDLIKAGKVKSAGPQCKGAEKDALVGLQVMDALIHFQKHDVAAQIGAELLEVLAGVEEDRQSDRAGHSVGEGGFTYCDYDLISKRQVEALRGCGRVKDAISLLAERLMHWEEVQGPTSDLVLQAHASMGHSLMSEEDFEAAAAHFRVAYEGLKQNGVGTRPHALAFGALLAED